jgi:methionyl-tRNA formyltransferase
VQVLADLPAYPPQTQPEDGVTYAAKIDKSETRLDFLTSAAQVERQVRAFAPTGPFSNWRANASACWKQRCCRPMRARRRRAGHGADDALAIACNPGAIRVTRIQRAGKSAMSAGELLRGFPIPAGTRGWDDPLPPHRRI